MIETDSGLRDLLHASVADVRAPESIRLLLPPGRQRLRVRHSVLVVVPLVALLAAGAAVAVANLQTNKSRVPRLFIRTTDEGVRIRAFTGVGIPNTGLNGELSTGHAVGLVGAQLVSAAPLEVRALDVTVFGTNGHDATAVAVRAGSRISKVTVHFKGGSSDTMQPVSGWAILADTGEQRAGSVTGYNTKGKAVATGTLPSPSNPGGPPEVSTPTFVRTTGQGVLVVGHIDNGFLAPDLADREAVQIGLEGYGVCTPAATTAIVPGVVVVGIAEGEPITVVLVHSGSAIAKVMVVFTNHVEDGMHPIAGQSVLATLGTVANNGSLLTLKSGVVEGFGKTGKLLSTVTLSPLANGDCLSFN
jgi:hypothetical protein